MTNLSLADKTTTVESCPEFDVFSTIIFPPKGPQPLFKVIKTERIPSSQEIDTKEYNRNRGTPLSR